MEKRRLEEGTVKRNLGSYNVHHLVSEFTIANPSVANTVEAAYYNFGTRAFFVTITG
jgi:hypothetical protein